MARACCWWVDGPAIEKAIQSASAGIEIERFAFVGRGHVGYRSRRRRVGKGFAAKGGQNRAMRFAVNRPGDRCLNDAAALGCHRCLKIDAVTGVGRGRKLAGDPDHSPPWVFGLQEIDGRSNEYATEELALTARHVVGHLQGPIGGAPPLLEVYERRSHPVRMPRSLRWPTIDRAGGRSGAQVRNGLGDDMWEMT